MQRREQVFIWRRKRERVARRQTRPFLWTLHAALGLFLTINVVMGVVLLLGIGSAGGVYAYFAQDLPAASAIEFQQEEFETVRIYDRTGTVLLYEVIDPRPFRGDRTYVALKDIPLHMRQAAIALEDRSFYDNPGINLRGIARAFMTNLRGGHIEGGSSITQQLIKNVFFDFEERTERSYVRKIKEVILALEITSQYEKDQILEWYLNYNFYGNLAYGVEAASQGYFGKSVSDLTVAESAMLAAIPQFPILNPIDRPAEARHRQGLVLQAMVEAGYLTQAEADAALAEQLHVRRRAAERFEIAHAPHFTLHVLDELQRTFNTADDPYAIWRKGVSVYTTIDLDLQREVERAAREQLARLQQEMPDSNASNAAVVVLRPNTGEVLAMLGSVDYYDDEIDGQVNVATSRRQPGSAFKPITYAEAFRQGLTPATMTLDVRTVFDGGGQPYVPENFDRNFRGPVRLRHALANSYNIPAVRTMDQVGVGNVINLARRMGFETLERDLDFYGLSLTLGGGEVRLLDMVFAFNIFANNGIQAGEPKPADQLRPGYSHLKPVSILQVRDKRGNVLKQYRQPETERILEPQVVFLINDVLSDVPARWPMFGRGNALELSGGRPAAAKTGTTNDFRDNWTVGYTPQVAVGVWMGNSDNQPMGRVSGARGSAPIWNAIMENALADKPHEPFHEPPGIVRATICEPSGLLPTPECPDTSTEIFMEGTVPTTYDTVYRAFEINRETGKLATVYTPPELRQRVVYQIYPREADDWVRAAGIPQPPAEFDAAGPGDFDPHVAIMEPAPYSYVRGVIELRGNARMEGFRSFRVDVGAGLNPSSWTQIGPEHGHQVGEDVLEFWDTSGFDGLYTLRLSVHHHDGSVHTAAAPVTVDNNPPRVTIRQPTQGQLFRTPEDEWISVQADANDDWAMDRVEFYRNGEFFAVSTVPPYNERWTIPRGGGIGAHEFMLRAYDQAGNVATSETVRITVEAGSR